MKRIAALIGRTALSCWHQGIPHLSLPAWAPGPPYTCPQIRHLAAKQINAKPVKLEKPQKQEVEIKQRMTVSELAKAMNKDIDHVYEALLNTDVDLDELEPDTVLEEKWIKEAVTRSGMKHKWAKLVETKVRENKYPETLVPRAPMVTIMGHVDHGKTTLLDSLRKSQIAAQEAGGITQHIGQFCDEMSEKITFLDTPGHAAFSALKVQHIWNAKNLKLNISKPLRTQISLQGDNLLELAEATVILAEVLELKGDPTGLLEGTVIESRTDKGKGPVTTAIIQRGTLRKGCTLVAGKCWAKVRFMFDEYNQAVSEIPVEIVGWKDLPSAGEEILEVESEVSYKLVIWNAKNLKLNISKPLRTQISLQGDNLLELAEATVILAEVLELKGDPTGLLEGTVIESRTDKGTIYRFNVAKGIPLRLHRVIYKLIDELKDDLSSKLPPTTEENIIGEFNFNILHQSCQLDKKMKFRLIRGRNILREGSVTTLKHLKDEVLAVKTGMECGLSLDNEELEYKPGDEIICYSESEIKQKISWDPGF
uniref:Translation initiation factor IF-2, mitochondrial n=1 Tax=Sinocyclocheilus rhinocerous TaxID=307959 RepID=A0A673JZE5_9TELE